MDTVPSSTPSFQPHDALERITLQMASCLDLQLVLTTITQGLVDELDGAFARIWLLGPGDLCAGCYKNRLNPFEVTCLIQPVGWVGFLSA